MTSNVDYNIEMVKGVKTALFGGEGLFFATLRGPGSVWIQSLPFSRLASRVFAAAPQRVEDQKMKAALVDFSICLVINKKKNKTGLMC